jgi:adenylylsulfate kinase
VWLTGAPTADRRSAAYALAERLQAEQRRVEVLDRLDGPFADAGRVGLMAEVLARNGVVVIVPCAAESVAAVRERHQASGTRYLEVQVPVAGQRSPEASTAAVHGLLVGRG